MRTLTAVAAIVLALTGCATSPSGPPPTVEPLDPADTAASLTTTEESTPETDEATESSSTTETVEEVPTSTDDLPGIWVEISALYAQKPAETRSQTCEIIHDDLTSDATVQLWQLDYQATTGEEADPDEVRTVLLWLCQDA